MASVRDLVRVRSQRVEALLRAADEARRHTTMVPDLDRFALELEVVRGTQRISLTGLLNEVALVVLHGPPGSGKTIALLKAQRRMATALRLTLEQRSRPSRTPQLPVYINVARAEGAALTGILVHPLLMRGEPLAILAGLLGELELVLLLDGLNELPKKFRRQVLNELVNLVSALKARHLPHELRVVLATRTYLLGDELDYLRQARFALVEVAPIDGARLEREFGRAVGLPASRARALLDGLDPQTRALLSTAQNLDCVTGWIRSRGELTDSALSSARTRGALLEHCVRRRFSKHDDPTTAAALAMLGRLAYSLTGGDTRFSRRDVVTAARESAELFGLADHVPMVETVFGLRVLVDGGDDLCRFDHHSHQQYFLAKEMTARPSEWARYVKESIWHEALVLMAGIVPRGQQTTLLDMAAVDRPLYAYLLANIDWPERQRAFLSATVDSFQRDLRRVATGLARDLKALTLLWIVFLTFSLFAVAVAEGVARTLLTIGVPALILAPFTVIRWHQRRITARLSDLRHVQLPDLLAVNRPFRERGMLKAVLARLEQMMLSFKRSHYSPDDPRMRFLTDAVAMVHEAIETTIALSEDEILAQLTDPLIAQALEPTQVSEEGVNELIAYATRPSDHVVARRSAIRMLGRIWPARPEFRDKIGSAVGALVTDRRQARAIRREAADTCRDIGLAVGHADLWFSVRQTLTFVTLWLKRLLAPRAMR